MTKRITVSLPDEIADRIDQEANASAFVSDAVRRTIASERTRAMLIAGGVPITEDGIAHQRELLHEADQRRAAKLSRRAA